MSDAILRYLSCRMLKYVEYFPLWKISSIRIGPVARFCVYPEGADQFLDLVRFLRASGVGYMVIGRLTNILLCMDEYPGVVICTSKMSGKNIYDTRLTAECGCPMPLAVRYAASLGLGGIEPLGTIPGSVGGCVAGNAGAFGVECSDALVSAEVYFNDTDEMLTFGNNEMRFSYRHSLLKERDAYVLSATFGLAPKEESVIFSEIDGIVKKRIATQPTGARSLGSIFKRVGDVGAGYYIDAAGLKGFRLGGAAVSDKHAGFIVNQGGATADDVLSLIELIKSRVFSIFGVTLEEEIEIIR